MDRRQLVAVTAILIVLCIAAAGATIDTATWETGEPTPPSGQSELGASGPPGSSLLVAVYLSVVIFALVGVFFGIRSEVMSPRQLAIVAVLLGVAGVIVSLLLDLTGTRVVPPELLDALERLGFAPERNATGDLPAGNATAGAEAPGSGADSALLSLGLAGALVGLVGFAIVGLGRLLGRESPSPTGSSSGDGRPAVGRAAGRAAERLGDAQVEDPISRAWYEMVTALEVPSPESTTPAAFAEAAVEAGLDPDDVAELTALFRESRYGTKPASQDRIDRAVELLRRIEATSPEGDQSNRGDGV